MSVWRLGILPKIVFYYTCRCPHGFEFRCISACRERTTTRRLNAPLDERQTPIYHSMKC